jgi:hypothetical protein
VDLLGGQEPEQLTEVAEVPAVLPVRVCGMHERGLHRRLVVRPVLALDVSQLLQRPVRCAVMVVMMMMAFNNSARTHEMTLHERHAPRQLLLQGLLVLGMPELVQDLCLLLPESRLVRFRIPVVVVTLCIYTFVLFCVVLVLFLFALVFCWLAWGGGASNDFCLSGFSRLLWQCLETMTACFEEKNLR